MRLPPTTSIIVGIGMLASVSAGCNREQDPRERDVIAWAEKNGMAIDDWQAGELPDESFDYEEWIEEGRAIPDVEPVLQKLLREGDERIEPILLVGALGVVGTTDSVPLLIEQLKDDWQVMRAEAIWSLGHIGGPEAIRTLAVQLCYGATFAERSHAARAFVNIGDPIGIEALEDAIEERREEQAFIEQALADLRRKLGTAGPRASGPSSQAAAISSQATSER